MFTGLITDVGAIEAVSETGFVIASSYPADDVPVGASIACDGVCLTATTVTANGDGCTFTVDASNETKSKTTLREWTVGRRINLERSLKAGDELGGHIVSGHVDGVARIVSITPDGDSRRFLIEVPEHLAMYIAPKGSVALDGTSLTINDVAGIRFGINLIPHSLTVTTWGAKTAGTDLNLEVDVFARYVARQLEFRR
ncbi:MAG: riboflavin synthase [Pseudomonadota bacterium]